MTKALVSPFLYWGSLSKEYPLHHNHTHPTKFSSEFRKLMLEINRSLFTHVSIDQENLNAGIEASMYLFY